MYSVFSGVKAVSGAKTLVCEIEVRAIKWTVFFFAHWFVWLSVVYRVMVRMKNLLNNNVWLWDRGKFLNRRFLMQVKPAFPSRKFVYTTRLKIDRFMVTSPQEGFSFNQFATRMSSTFWRQKWCVPAVELTRGQHIYSLCVPWVGTFFATLSISWVGWFAQIKGAFIKWFLLDHRIYIRGPWMAKIWVKFQKKRIRFGSHQKMSWSELPACSYRVLVMLWTLMTNFL